MSNDPPTTEAQPEHALSEDIPQHPDAASSIQAAMISAEQMEAARKVLETHAGRHAASSSSSSSSTAPLADSAP
jgi:hypothetical protein